MKRNDTALQALRLSETDLLAVYNKIFTKILDSSIWLEPTPTRMIWFVFLASMDEDGFCQFASPANLAYRARLTPEETAAALETLEAPDPNSSDPDHDGRRIERVPGGWIVLNATKYRTLVTREVAKEKNRERVKRHRQKKGCNGGVMPANESVTQSEALAEAGSGAETKTKESKATGSCEPVMRADLRSKEEKLEGIESLDLMDEEEFDEFLQEHDFTHIIDKRSDLFYQLCRDKWHSWDAQYEKWKPIRDLAAYVGRLNEIIAEAPTASF